MKTVFLSITRLLFFSSVLIAGQAFALAPDIEADRLLLSASKALETKDFPKAVVDLEKARTLGVQLPVNFQFHYATALAGAGRLTSAKHEIESYLNKQGKKAKYYAEALALLNSTEEAIAARNQSQAAAQATQQAAYASCVSEIESTLSSLDELNRKYATAQRDETWCWEECNRNYCTETGAAPLKRCNSLKRDAERYEDEARDVRYMKETPDYAATTCRKAHPVTASQADD